MRKQKRATMLTDRGGNEIAGKIWRLTLFYGADTIYGAKLPFRLGFWRYFSKRCQAPLRQLACPASAGPGLDIS